MLSRSLRLVCAALLAVASQAQPATDLWLVDLSSDTDDPWPIPLTNRDGYDNQPHVSLLAYEEIRDRLIMLDGWSKTYAMTGWRLGYAVWPESLVEPVTKLAVNDHSCVNAATQWAGVAALDAIVVAATVYLLTSRLWRADSAVAPGGR